MTFRRVMELAGRYDVPHKVIYAGMLLGDLTGTQIEVLHPPRGFVPGTKPSGNDNSVVLRIIYKDISVLLAGDIEEAGLPWLLGAAQDLNSTVLKVPHHGSRLGVLGEVFFRAVEPELAIISVGRIHHLPAPETLNALRPYAGRILSTRKHGAVRIYTNGKRLVVSTAKDIQ